MSYPTPSKKRKVDVVSSYVMSYDRGNDSKDKAPKVVVGSKLPKKETSSQKFRAVKDNPRGVYQVVRYTYLYQPNVDRWGVTGQDWRSQHIEFFTPHKFKDAEAVCFNGKAITYNGYGTTSLAVNGPTLRPIYVDYSHVRFDFHNITQNDCQLEMYICYGKGKASATLPWTDLDNALKTLKGSTTTFTELGFDPMTVKPWVERWDVTKVEIAFEPGEKCAHLLKGPKKYCLDPALHTASGTEATTATVTWNTPEREGNGCYVFFRMLNRLTLVCMDVASDGAANPRMGGRKVHAHHPANKVPSTDGDPQGGIIVKMSEYYRVAAPEDYQGGEVHFKQLDFHSYTPGSTDKKVRVDTDQSMTLVTDPI